MAIEYVGQNQHLQITHTPDSLFYFLQITDMNSGRSVHMSCEDAIELADALRRRAVPERDCVS